MANFISPRYRQHYLLALIAVFIGLTVIVLGGYTRLTDAGLSCPDWPHCYGFLGAPHTNEQLQKAALVFPASPINVKKAWTEMTHRYFAGTEGLLVLVLAAGVLCARRFGVKGKIIGLALIALLIVQILLGMLTVTEKLKPIIVLSHLLTGLSLVSILWWAYLDLFFRHDLYTKHGAAFKQQDITRGTVSLLWLGLAILVCQISLGGWVSTHLAGLACVDFPYCNGVLLPAIQWQQLNSDLISIHMLHRIGALITALYFVFLIVRLFQGPYFKKASFLMAILLLSQLVLGILNIILLRPVHVALTHQAIAILLLFTVIATLVKAHLLLSTHNE